MLREYQRFFDRIHIFVGGIFIFLSFGAIYLILDFYRQDLWPFNEYMGIIGIFALIVMASLYVRRVSVTSRLITHWAILTEILTCFIFGLLGISLFDYLLRFPEVSRVFFIGGVLVSYGSVVSWFIANHWLLSQLRSHDINQRKVLLIGNKYTLPLAIDLISKNKKLGMRIAGIMGLEEHTRKEFMGFPYFGGLHKMNQVLNKEIIDYAIFTVYRQNPLEIEQAMLACSERGIEVWLKPDFMHKEVMVSRVDYLQDTPFFIFALGPKYGLSLFIKRIIDILGSAFLLTVFFLPLAVIALVIGLSTHGPFLFQQERVGLNGRKISFYKFRTMYHELQEVQFEQNLRNEMQGPVFKMKDDPRITPMGRFLRRYSLDELPQFWNVIVGDMSLVGPRPPLPSEVNLYEGWQRRRLSMRPGITCIWQVTGRNKIEDFEAWTKLDLKYIDEWNLWLDIKILFKTIPAVLKGTGL